MPRVGRCGRPMAAMARPGHGPGDRVMALFRMRSHHSVEGHTLQDSNAEFRYMPVEAPMLRYRWPKVGWSVRWLPATIVQLGHEGAEVQWDHPHWIDWSDGDRVGAPKHWVPMAHLQGLAGVEEEGVACPTLGGWEPMLSLVEVRWGDLRRPVDFHPDSWGAVGSSISPSFIGSFHDTFFRLCGSAVEILTVFVSRTADLTEVSEAFVRAQLRGRHMGVLYFLWPAHAGDQMAAEAGHGYVDPPALYRLMRNLESVGIPTRWPHASPLAEVLASKAWLAGSCLDRSRLIPATTRVNRALVVRDPQCAARAALAQLLPLAKAQGLVPEDATEETVVCVTKLGFSYEARAVVECTGATELGNALSNLLDQFSYHECVFVQARVPDVALELRVGVVRGAPVNIAYTRMGTVTETGYFCEFSCLPREQALLQWLGGDEPALVSAEEQARHTCLRWWEWLSAEASEGPVSVRVDFLVRRTRPGCAEAWTCEVGEQGYSSVGWEDFPDTVFPEVFAECLHDVDCVVPDCGCLLATQPGYLHPSGPLEEAPNFGRAGMHPSLALGCCEPLDALDALDSARTGASNLPGP